LTSDQVSRLIAAVAQLVGVLAWPAVLFFFLAYFRSSLREFISGLSEFSFKAPGIEATAKRQQAVAAAALGAAEAIRAPVDGVTVDPGDIAEALPDSRAQRRIQGSHVIWVDDRPDNNVFERKSLEAFGIIIDISISTQDALTRIRKGSFNLVISDMGRPPDARAGYTLLDALRQSGDKIPFVIYASSRAPEHVRESREHGAIGCTNSPVELISMVTGVLAARS
jgi:CheY-like chemotaxis protein